MIGDLVGMQQRLDIYCGNPHCRRPTVEMTPAEAVALIGANVTFTQAGRRLRCTVCGERGRIQCRASMSDHYYWCEVMRCERNGYPPPKVPDWLQDER